MLSLGGWWGESLLAPFPQSNSLCDKTTQDEIQWSKGIDNAADFLSVCIMVEAMDAFYICILQEIDRFRYAIRKEKVA